MRILETTFEFPPFFGGAANYSYLLANSLSKEGHQLMVLTVRSRGHDAQADKNYPFQIIRIPVFSASSLLARFLGVVYFLYLVLIYKPDRVLVTEGLVQKAISLVYWLPFVKYLIIFFGSEIIYATQGKGLRFQINKFFLKRFWHRAHRIIAISEFTKGLLVKNGISPGRIKVIYAGIDLNRFSRYGNLTDLRQKLGLKNEKIILTLARLVPRKNQDKVIMALPLVIDKFPNLKYIIVGSGGYEERLRQIVKMYNLKKNVIFAGLVSEHDKIDFYALCDVFIMPNRQEGIYVEGLGISFLEAQAMEKPVIGGRHGGALEAVLDGETGLLVDPNDTQGIANAIIKLLSDEQFARELGKKGRRRCEVEFDMGKNVKQIIDLLSE